ncbi:MAG: GMC oxidoreductase [Chloroflexaceae bacterium]
MSERHYDAVVVGSGFGGSVMAYRLAEAGRRVCVLERGKPYPPGSFPRSPYGMKTNLWDPSEGLYGLYNIWSFRGLGAIVASGLGGGSLIYANVLLRKDERWFVREDLQHGGYEYWPVTRADLDPHYDRVERMLHAQVYPLDHPSFNTTAKTNALKAAAEALGFEWFLPPLAVTFANEGEPPVTGEPIREEHPNLHGRTRYTCRLVGECMFGCNFGSKNTMDYTYLSAAQRLGAEIHTRCEVRAFAPRPGGGYTVDYVAHDPAHEGQKLDTHNPAVVPLQTITADRLILAAGTLGSSYLLLKNRHHFPNLSPRLGTRFSGNGDLLSFAVKSRHVLDPGYGPAITSTVRVPDELDGGVGRGFYVQDGGYPDMISWMLQALDSPGLLWRGVRLAKRLFWQLLRRDPETDLGAEIAALFGSTRLSVGTLPLLGMGRDIPDGNVFLRGNRLDVDWNKLRSSPFFDRLLATSQVLAEAMDAKFKVTPTYWLDRLLTVHPLGGCPMGRNELEGVVDPYGQVFNSPGLYVADGAVMPGPVGPNPSLTIAALSDRFADHVLEGSRG